MIDRLKSVCLSAAVAVLLACQGLAAQEASTGAASTSAVPESAVAEYLANYVWFENQLTVSTYSYGYGIHQSYSTVVSSGAVPLKGRYHEPLEGRRFYDHIGRLDLGEYYQKRTVARWTLIGTGTVLSVAGMVMMFVGLDDKITAEDSCAVPWPDSSGSAGEIAYEACADNARSDEESGQHLMVSGIVMLSVGAAAMIVSAFINPHPVDESGARRLADEYNNNLKKRLGIPPQMPISASARSLANTSGVEIRTLPQVSRGSGGMLLHLSF